MSSLPPKILHFCYSGRIQSGILKQLRAEYEASVALGLGWTIVYFTHEKSSDDFVHSTGLKTRSNGVIAKAFRYIMLRVIASYWLLKHQKKFDIVLLRYVVGDVFVAINASIANKYFTVHHTKELEEAVHQGKYVSKFSLAVEYILGKRTLRKAEGIIAVTQEIVEYERARASRDLSLNDSPHYVYSNGLDFSRSQLADDLRGGVPKFVFVAAVFQPWHGLDLLLEQLRVSDEVFELHLVGNLDGLHIDDPRVILHGTLSETEILELVGQMDIGIGSLGMFRNDLKEAATLKVREYFANGLPVYATHRDAGLPQDFPYFYFHTTLNINNIIEAALRSREYSRLDIRTEAECYLSKVERLKLLNNQLAEHLSKK